MKGWIFMSNINKNLHLTLQERQIIQTGIENGSTKVAIATTIGKDKSTIGKEIKAHRQLSHRCSYTTDCIYFKKCSHNHICQNCDDYRPFKCSRRDRSPGACNGCNKYQSCRYDKFRYSAANAQKEYEYMLVDSRIGINMTYLELKAIANTVIPLIKAGQSPYQVITNHPELGISEKTLYNYIEQGVFREFGLLDIDLRLKVKRKMNKNDITVYKKRRDKKHLEGRTYKDLIEYIGENPDASIVEMDTVYNNVTGPFMQTFKFLSYSFIYIIYHEEKTERAMVAGLDLLENIIGKELFAKEAAIIKTDRGSEFDDADGLEKAQNGTKRTHVFYCDPMASNQKGSLENNHKGIRYICPKENDLKELGLDSQEKANLMVSHINSQPKEKLKGRTPLEIMKFMNPELFKRFIEHGIEEIEKDKVILKPYLLKNKK